MQVHQAFRFALDPSPRVERALASHVGARRFVFNWGLALVKERLDARDRGETVAVPWTLPELRREWNQAKATVAPWWPENSKEAYSSGLESLARALQAWSKSRKGQRRGRRVAFLDSERKGGAENP
ncbi:MAG: helix-turn-helix domain-containing protein [Firmicutes bacterium]|nr:helix-turn-helix domain-containing protein [Bacillota bacterium]